MPHASQGTPPQSRTSHFMHILCMLARDEPEALRYRAMPGGGSPAERLCAPRVRGGSKPNPAPRNLGLDLILDNPTTNAPPPIHPVPPTFLHPDPSLLASSELGTQNTDACTAVPSRASIERTWMVPLLPQLARTECLSPRRGHCHSPCTPKQPAMRCIAASDQLQLMTCSRVPPSSPRRCHRC